MSNSLLLSILIPCLFQVQVAEKTETPAEGLKAMIAYLEKDDLQGLFLVRYGELDRFAKTEEEKQKIVGQIVQQFSNKKAMLLDGFKKAQTVEPEILERNGEKVAVFKVEKVVITLYLKKGIWTFHL